MVGETDHKAIVTNTTFRRCPWASILYAYDRNWWKQYIKEVREVFSGDKFCESPHLVQRDIRSSRLIQGFHAFGNSGASAVALAIALGSRRIVMLGYDCEIAEDGRTHWHGNHPEGLQNCDSIGRWPSKFERLSRYAASKGATVLNATRSTALTCFERRDLADCL